MNFTKNDQRAIAAELLGTMFFVIVGTGAVVSAVAVSGGLDGPALIAIALAHGIGILTAAAWTGNISGGHINPAVTLAMIVTKHISVPKGVAYIVAQLVGAVIGSLLVKLAMPNGFEGGLGNHSINPVMTTGEGLVLEIILTAFLVLVIYNTAVSKKGWSINAPIAIGLAVAVIHLVAVPWTGASVNPARSFGPALVANEWDDFWVYILGPAIGALIIGAMWLVWREWGEDALEDAPADAPAA